MMVSRSLKTLGKKERICGKKDISALLSKGKFGTAGCLRYCCLKGNGAECDRIMVSVPKKLFKRAIRRNSLKRCLRESFRLQKSTLATALPVDIMFVYNTKELKPFGEIYTSVQQAISAINNSEKDTPDNGN